MSFGHGSGAARRNSGGSGGALGQGRGLRGGGAHHGSIWGQRWGGDGTGEPARRSQAVAATGVAASARRQPRHAGPQLGNPQ
jgi:hypothetical protein